MKKASIVLLFLVLLVSDFFFAGLSSWADEVPVFPDVTKTPYRFVMISNEVPYIFPEQGKMEVWIFVDPRTFVEGTNKPNDVFGIYRNSDASYAYAEHLHIVERRDNGLIQAECYGFIWDKKTETFVFKEKKDMFFR